MSTSTCVYCGNIADTKDHVPPKSLLEKPYPNNLFTLPACLICNRGFSLDEEYFETILAHIGNSELLDRKITEDEGKIDRALRRRPALDQQILESVNVTDTRRWYMNPQTDRLERIVHKIAFGLYIRQYKEIPEWNHINVIRIYPGIIPEQIKVNYSFEDWTYIQAGVFSYIFINEDELYCMMNFYNSLLGCVIIKNVAGD